MGTAEMERGGTEGTVPPTEEVFEMLERGELDVTASEADAEELPVVAEEDIAAWIHNQAQALRAAGKRGTWEGRRGIRERSFADREKPAFVGRYAGKCVVTPRMLEAEYGSPNPTL